MTGGSHQRTREQERYPAHSVDCLAGGECIDAAQRAPATGEHKTGDVAEADIGVDDDLVVMQRASQYWYSFFEAQLILTQYQ
jgi:hypothetical protein